MTLEERPFDAHAHPNDDLRLRPSFHGRLLIRSSEKQPEHQIWRKLARHADQWGWLAQLIGQGSIFAGGVAIGGGAMLLKRGEDFRIRPELMIAIGFGCVLFAIAAQLLVKELRKHAAPFART